MIKYQIFVSSTYDDLKDERSQVIKAILEMGHIPVGMEMFSAADEEQWKIIARQIDETDYYVIIVGNRYGSVTGGVSYTEKEFDYAVSKGIPVLGFVIDSSVESLAKNVDTVEEKVAALGKFKSKVKQRPVGFWKTAEELHGKVSIALMKAFNTTPRIGWTRATDIAGPEVTNKPTQPAPGKPETTHPQPPRPNAAPGLLPPGSGPPRATAQARSARQPSRARSWPGSRGGRVTHRSLARDAHLHPRSRACA
ncbi:MAG: DUF4062 domain-containing protein [Stenotrophomonas maltophilia]